MECLKIFAHRSPLPGSRPLSFVTLDNDPDLEHTEYGLYLAEQHDGTLIMYQTRVHSSGESRIIRAKPKLTNQSLLLGAWLAGLMNYSFNDRVMFVTDGQDDHLNGFIHLALETFTFFNQPHEECGMEFRQSDTIQHAIIDLNTEFFNKGIDTNISREKFIDWDNRVGVCNYRSKDIGEILNNARIVRECWMRLNDPNFKPEYWR